MIGLRGRVRRLEGRRIGGALGTQVVQILETARIRRSVGQAPCLLPFDHWPFPEELDRQAAGTGELARLADARLRLLTWPEPAQ